ncbi:DUF5658 family protein [Halorussus caseinilyticus]|uniref:DUF5658 family protein n=1 Tax=Halorussus caseinilyticus TaxID=3034025 RepID=UPI0023E7729E|nr:DUF5658 family protein [Halorussus sp. DT72]
MSESDPSGIDAPTGTDPPASPQTDGDGVGDLADSKEARERWMHRDDEFLLEEDREYVLRDEGRSWWGYVSSVLFGAVVALMVGDVVTTGFGMAMGLEEVNPVASAVLAEAGLAGLVLLKAMAAVVLVVLPGVTGNARRTFRAGGAVYLLAGLLVVVGNAWAILAVA